MSATRNTNVTVLKPCTIYSEARAVGARLLVDSVTAENLIRKGILAALVEKEPEPESKPVKNKKEKNL